MARTSEKRARWRVGCKRPCARARGGSTRHSVSFTGNQPPRSAGSGGTLAERYNGAAWKVAEDLLAAALSVSLNWVCSTAMRCFDSESPAAAAMEYHLYASSRL